MDNIASLLSTIIMFLIIFVSIILPYHLHHGQHLHPPHHQVNLKTSGLKDPVTAHGGCPVLVGSKWITNKWVIIQPWTTIMIIFMASR